MAFATFALLATAQAQEIPRPSLSRMRDATPSLDRPYNLKIGPISFSMNAGVGFEFVDNVNLSAEDSTGDVIITPYLGVSGAWQVTKLNSLEMRTTLGYTKYLEHPDLDSQTALISPDSEIRLNIFVGDVKFVIRESFSIEEDTVNEGGVSGVARLGRYTNTVGVTALWDLNDVIWSLGVDRYDFITIGNTANTEQSLNNYSLLDHHTHQLSTAALVRLNPTTRLGAEATAAYTEYSKNPNGDSAIYSVGPFLEMQLTRYTHVALSGGYQIYESETGNADQGTNEAIATSATALLGLPQSGSQSRRQNGDGSGYYFSFSVNHRLNRYYQNRLRISREFQVGLLSDRTETTSVSYSFQWTLNRRISLSGAVFYDDVQTVSSAFRGALLGDYERYGFTIGTSYQLTKKLNVSLRYQFTNQSSEEGTRDYAQNRAGIQFGYQF